MALSPARGWLYSCATVALRERDFQYEFKYVEDNARVASREVEFEDVDHGVPFRMFFKSGPGSFDYNFIYADDSSGNYELTNLPIPTIGDTDFRFDGWYTSRDYLIKVAESFAATGDITVYAKWITDVKFVNCNLCLQTRIICNSELQLTRAKWLGAYGSGNQKLPRTRDL